MTIEHFLMACVIVAGAMTVASMVLDVATVIRCARQQKEMDELMREWREYHG